MNYKRLAGLSCLELRKEILDSARKHVRTRAIWSHYIQEVCKRIVKRDEVSENEEREKFTPTDISLILAAFATSRKRDAHLFNLLLETSRTDIDKFNIRDFAVLYNALAKVGMRADDMINSFSSNIEAKINAKSSEKDLALLLNAMLELAVSDLNGIFVKASLVISSRIKYIANCHTLTLLLHSYSRFKGFDRITERPKETTARSDEQLQTDIDNVLATVTEPSPESTLITETTLSLLGRCADLMMEMRATDVMYFYRASLNLIYANSEGVTQHLYASICNLHKAHIRIREHLLEFEARELIALLETFQNTRMVVDGNAPLDLEGALWVTNSEILNQTPSLQEEVTSELLYRTTVMSFSECLAFIKLLPFDDHRGILVYRRLLYKVKKMKELNSWERCERSDLWDLIIYLTKRSDIATSVEAQELMVVLTKGITGTLKLKEVDAMCRLAACLGAKSNSLLKKIMSVPCRVDYLQAGQAASLLYHLTGLGYIEHLQPIVAACLEVDNSRDALNVLVSLTILKINRLMDMPGPLVDKMLRELDTYKGDLDNDDVTLNKIAFLRLAGIVALSGYSEPYRIYPRMYAPSYHVEIPSVQLMSNNKLNVDICVLCLPQCIEDIANSLKDFLAQFDKNTLLHYQYDAGDMVVPIVIELPGSQLVAVHVLLNDFYSGSRQMLRIDVYAQLMLMNERGFRTVCCRADEYVNGNKTQFIAKLVERCHASGTSNIAQESEPHTVYDTRSYEPTISPLQPKLDSFSRLRQLVSDGGRRH
ncbi:uncharacterized protein BXIN_1189 [Babesia sp. Xinjiang]|uniref:uncharacterized protein n=1 Tax=Babesia sp. Xinjiang TaxID=462227 RepID=UPI000A226503|nr:uncharacterized protein BXIN_1189 [Babesia sp. Xinjiang]ORM40027.1 hypothetical protein BXIN_1189 [Babesia sp. Xinjiang]